MQLADEDRSDAVRRDRRLRDRRERADASVPKHGTRRVPQVNSTQHFVHEVQSNKILELEPVDSADNVADLLTKPLLKAALLPLRSASWASKSDYCSNSNTV